MNKTDSDNDVSETKGVCAVWDFRANEEVFNPDVLSKWMKSNCKKYAFQLEKSDSGYVHWQGRFSLIKKRSKTPLLRSLSSISLTDMEVNYLAPTSKENRSNFFYVLKEDTRVSGPWMDETQQRDTVYIPRQFRNKTLYPWQEHVRLSAEEFNDRIIDVIVDAGPISGNKGKSFISAYMSLMYGSVSIPLLNDHKDIIAYVCSICYNRNLRDPRVMFCDMPRAMDKRHISYFYTAMEQIKKGELIDSRYSAKVFWIDSPRIWVFTNEKPDTSFLSRDRWRFWQITDDMRLAKYVDERDIDTSSLDTVKLDEEIVQVNETLTPIHSYARGNISKDN